MRDENTGADAHLDATRELERDDGFAHRSARNAEQDRELALGRQPRACRKFAIVDQRGDLPGDLPIQARRLHCLQRHWLPLAATAAPRAALPQ